MKPSPPSATSVSASSRRQNRSVWRSSASAACATSVCDDSSADAEARAGRRCSRYRVTGRVRVQSLAPCVRLSRYKDKGLARRRHCPVSGRGRRARVPSAVSGGVRRPVMLEDGIAIFEWGRRASDQGHAGARRSRPGPAAGIRIAHEQIDVLFQPLIEPSTGRSSAPRRWRGRPSPPSAEALFARAAAAGLARAPVAARPAQGAALRGGLGRSAQGTPALDQPASRGHFARGLRRLAARRDRRARASIRRG